MSRQASYLWFIAALARLCCAITVFDCESLQANYTVLDLHDPAPCLSPTKDYEPGSNQLVQILQTDAVVPTRGFNCQATITKEVVHCGFTSITYATITTVWKEDAPITPAECRQAVKTGRLKINKITYNVGDGRKVENNYVSNGKVHDDGSCETTIFMSGGQMFQDAYEKTIVEVHVKSIRGTHDLATGKVTFANQLTANYKDQVMRDDHEGIITWEIEKMKCIDTVSGIYHGKSSLHVKRERDAEEGDLTDSILMVQEEKTQQFAGLILKEKRSLCGHECYNTQILGVVACMMWSYDEPIAVNASFKKYYAQHGAAIQTQMAFLHLGSNLRMHNRFEQVQQDLCEVDRRVLYTRLQAMSGSGNQHSLLDIFPRGHQIYISGGAAYVVQCEAREATKANHPNCTEQVPVMVNGTKKFADPFTWVLQDYPDVLPCSDLTPVRWRIKGAWFCATPVARACPAPEQLRTLSRPFMPTGNIASGLDGGIYTPAQVLQHHIYQRTVMARSPVLSSLTAAAASGHSGRRDGLGVILPQIDIDDLQTQFATLVIPMYPVFGALWGYICLLYFFGMCAKLICGGLIRAAYMTRARGCGWWIFASCWATTYHIFLIPQTVVGNAIEQITAPQREFDEGEEKKKEKEREESEQRRDKHMYEKLRQDVQVALSALCREGNPVLGGGSPGVTRGTTSRHQRNNSLSTLSKAAPSYDQASRETGSRPGASTGIRGINDRQIPTRKWGKERGNPSAPQETPEGEDGLLLHNKMFDFHTETGENGEERSYFVMKKRGEESDEEWGC